MPITLLQRLVHLHYHFCGGVMGGGRVGLECVHVSIHLLVGFEAASGDIKIGTFTDHDSATIRIACTV